ncbi:MAG: hypothetical protein IJL00_03145 [Clostridia bacterium]|nr:hypothetical protein [Clostridia bacterium]
MIFLKFFMFFPPLSVVFSRFGCAKQEVSFYYAINKIICQVKSLNCPAVLPSAAFLRPRGGETAEQEGRGEGLGTGSRSPAKES